MVRPRSRLVSLALLIVLSGGAISEAAARSDAGRGTPAGGRLAAAAHGTTRGLPMFIYGPYHAIRPRHIYFSGDGGNIVENLRWSSWTMSRATGEGHSDMQGCVPDCATGAEIMVPTLITLSDPVDGYFTRILERRDGQNTTLVYRHRPARGSFPQSAYGPGPAGPAASLEFYWGDIDTGAYAKAWTYLVPGVESETAFVDSEKQARPTNVELDGSLTGITGVHAAIVISRLITHDQQYGCRSWSGHYDMVRAAGRWRIGGAHITPEAC